MRPVDKLLASYLCFVTLVLLVRGGWSGSTNWWLLAAHVLLATLLVLFTRLAPQDRLGQLLHDLYPLVLLPALYAEIGTLSEQLDPHGVFARDRLVQSWEAALFGGQISYEWIRHAPSVFWSGLLHLAYLGYYPIVALGPILLVALGRREPARQVLLATMIAYLACYVVFILFPVAGPNYAFPHPAGPVREVWSAQLVYAVLGTGSSFGAAFPSSHVAATLAATLALWRRWRPLGMVFVVPALLLVVGTVYCQMHYGMDALTGVLVGIPAGWYGSQLQA